MRSASGDVRPCLQHPWTCICRTSGEDDSAECIRTTVGSEVSIYFSGLPPWPCRRQGRRRPSFPALVFAGILVFASIWSPGAMPTVTSSRLRAPRVPETQSAANYLVPRPHLGCYISLGLETFLVHLPNLTGGRTSRSFAGSSPNGTTNR